LVFFYKTHKFWFVGRKSIFRKTCTFLCLPFCLVTTKNVKNSCQFFDNSKKKKLFLKINNCGLKILKMYKFHTPTSIQLYRETLYPLTSFTLFFGGTVYKNHLLKNIHILFSLPLFGSYKTKYKFMQIKKENIFKKKKLVFILPKTPFFRRLQTSVQN